MFYMFDIQLKDCTFLCELIFFHHSYWKKNSVNSKLVDKRFSPTSCNKESEEREEVESYHCRSTSPPW